ncbi:efflux RND transporter periplasmic adaptor subunit [Lacihabitans sp. LS3-19]|uniref:efflux RND transporter periplasmic adaptor subunit n=1 Tax=Lacihabitans sp. LS3-19 TaxID=2487335 RepID=UPI0020CCCBED|nr:efflux RND transporter periplasmic adaptor subunit [Lacihabitans sp. LS3-19]MCP9767957.1 efflux RND transporter periplasmic adaptor subunit [Lacihabitans sp. LS3-19]
MKKLFFIPLVLGSLAFSCKTKEKKESKAIIQTQSIEVASVERQNFVNQISASGVLASKSEIKLAFKTGGMIKKVYVSEGQFVKAGQLLAELDMSEIDAQVNQANIGLQKAKRDFERVKKLYDDEAATQTNLQDATSGMEMATQTVKAAQFNQKLSRIYAPVSGKILRKIAEQGELIVPFSPAFILGTGTDAFIVNVGLADKDIVKLKIGDNAKISLDAYPNESFTGKISQIAQTINPASGTYEVELEMVSNGKKLISGFVAKAVIHPSTSNSSLVIPISALIEANGDQAFVFLYKNENSSVMRRPIKIGKIIDSKVQIINGLVEEDQVVTLGSGFVSDGEKVTLSHK